MLEQCDNIQSSFAFNRGQAWYGATAYWDYADYAGFDVNKLTFCGVVDVARIAKFGAYFFQSQTDPTLDMSEYGVKTGPMVFIANTWADDSPKEVRVFTNCDTVELYLDDKLIETRTEPDATMWAPHGNTDNPTGMPQEGGGADVSTENLEHPLFTFDLSSYTPGEGTLKAVAYLDGQKEPVATYVRSAPGEAAKITLTAENDEPLKLDGSTAKLVWVDVKDANGTVVNTADNTIHFETEGPGFVIGQKAVDVRGGQWAVWVRSTRGSGDITLKATSDGLTADTLVIKTQTVDGLPATPENGDADETDFVQPEAPAEAVNIFLNKTATASSENTASSGALEKASYANDGDENTKWCASAPNPTDAMGTHWWQVDLGRSYTVEEMEILFDAAGNWKYHVAVSDDPNFTDYTIPDSGILSTDQQRVTVEVNQTGQYVRLYLNCPASSLWPCLRGVSGTGYTDNLALGKKATASSTNTDSDVGNAVDGDAETFWNSGAMSPAWYQVDLGQIYQLTGASLTFAWFQDSNTQEPVHHSFTIQGSLDGAAWYDMGTWSDMDQGGKNPTATATVELDGAARYVKVYELKAYKNGTENQWAEIAELEVHGKALGEPVRLDYNAPTTATSSAEGSDPAYGNDGDPAKYWIPAADDQDPAWQFDAGGLYNIAAVSLTWNTAGVHKYAIDLSTDGQNWTTAVDRLTDGSASAKTTNDALSGLTRYVRIRLTAGTTDGLWINSTGFVKTPALAATSVEASQGVTAATGTAFDQLPLPKTVMATLEGNVKTPLAVTWNGEGYDPASTQAQTIPGVLKAIPGVSVPETLTTSVVVTLENQEGVTKYTVTFNTNGGSAIDPVTVAENGKVTKPADPTKEGFQFAGWFTDEACTNAYDFDTPVTQDMTLYAKWTEVEPEPTPVPTEQPEPTPVPPQQPQPTPAPTQQPEPTPAPTQQPEPTPAPTQQPQTTPAPVGEVILDNQTGNKITMGNADQVFQGNTVITVESVQSGAIYTRVEKALSNVVADMNQVEILEITAMRDGQAVQPSGGAVQVTFGIPKHLSADNLKLYYVDENGKVEEISITVNKDAQTVTANLTHFSTYVLANVKSTQSGNSVPPTGDASQLMGYAAAMGAAALLMGGTILVRKRRSK